MNRVGFRFEVFGKVQGVCFRASTVDKARDLKLRGWVRNTNRDTVEGEVEDNRKKWLSTEGSKYSRIDRCETEDYAESKHTSGFEQRR
ncbi:hypothetical protein PROFUN_04623 [Planoprotostelium fungivorum]|uniref:acylphosphatase n=1 Tax=Planoprotostelium fungivorum TaxID=1890364 RepID=A0A2P6NUI7_9EUKA|nr:hypothetical protein PROFUN_04623 [Planoprotostelium fungivorum]